MNKTGDNFYKPKTQIKKSVNINNNIDKQRKKSVDIVLEKRNKKAEKGTNLPVQKNKCIKIKNDGEKFLEIKIYEGEDNNVIKNKLISEVKIDKRNFKNEKVGNNYIEILIQFEISSELNLCVYVLDSKTMKRRFECLINIDVIKS